MAEDRIWGWDDIRKAHRPVTVTVRICMDGELLDEIHRLETVDLDRAVDADRDSDMASAGARRVAERIADLRGQAADAEVPFTCQAVGPKRWNDLQSEHPPTDEQRKRADRDGQRLRFNPESFPIAATAESLSHPTLTVEQVAELHDDMLNDGQWSTLWGAVAEANVGAATLGKASPTATRLLRGSAPKSEQRSG